MFALQLYYQWYYFYWNLEENIWFVFRSPTQHAAYLFFKYVHRLGGTPIAAAAVGQLISATRKALCSAPIPRPRRYLFLFLRNRFRECCKISKLRHVSPKSKKKYRYPPPPGEFAPGQDGLSGPCVNFEGAKMAHLGREKVMDGQFPL